MTEQSNDGTIDFGAHLHPEATIPDAHMNRPLTEHLGSIEYDAAVLSEWYDAAGITNAVLSQPYFLGHDDAAATAAANDALSEVLDEFNRFYGLAALPVGAGGDQAAREFERCIEHGYHGAGLQTRSGGNALTDPELEPIWEVADRTGAPVFVHPKLHDSLHPDVLDDDHLLNAIIGREAALLKSICTVIQDDLFASYPNLRLVYHHLGGNIGSMMGRIDLQLDPGRWPGRQEAVKEFDQFQSELEEHVYVDTAGFFAYRTPLQATIEAVPIENIVMGTDTPYEPRSAAELRRFVDVIDETLAPADARKVLRENALELLVNL